MPDVHGDCDARFSAVRTAFEENFRERGELGAAVSVTVGGETVVDLWGGEGHPCPGGAEHRRITP